MTPPRHVLIVGAGIHGLSTAYFLNSPNIPCTLIERAGKIAPGASSKAAGFLTKDWNDETPTEKLTRRSFELHQELANTFGADTIQYRRLQCVGVQVDPSGSKEEQAMKHSPKKRKQPQLEWRPPTLAVSNIMDMGDESSIAQVHPRLLCEQLWKACQATGLATLKAGRVVGMQHNANQNQTVKQQQQEEHQVQEPQEEDEVEGVILDDGTVISGDAVLFAAGAWTANIMYGIKGHSLILPTSRVLKQTIFFSSMSYGEPEVFVRPDQTAFVSGYPGDVAKVPNEVEAGSETIEPDVVEKLKQSVRACMGYNTPHVQEEPAIAVSGDPAHVQCCYQPCTDDFLPVMGKLSRRATGGGANDNVYIQGGHNCWGILLAPASGEAMADLIVLGKSRKVDLQPFRPSRYRNLKLFP
eukprot:CAMPEP_0178820276 /NCGR_PEP_ID=MMETSP0746-20121128/3425_1 /TAXON_ID=913974 /ORGANISM="Nitzschia punctata, Strain CCMP561" /LENGTH=411 /DNA_ID=CAMNT_0020481609 /DNA_START=1666 /DNA_END=2902 /DNA_ORIENTATION=+